MPGIDSFTKLMLHMDGADASTTFTDSASSPKTMTAVGNAQIDTDQSKFGGASGLFDGNGDYITTPSHADFDFGSGDFTIDFWVRYNSLSALIEGYCSKWQDALGLGHRGWEFYRLPSGAVNTLNFDYSTNGSTSASIASTATWVPNLNQWYHVAVVRSGNNILFFIDGVKLGNSVSMSDTIFAPTAIFTAGNIDVGSGATLGINGWMDELRISNGVARWTANFTPPVKAYNSNPSDSTITQVMLIG